MIPDFLRDRIIKDYDLDTFNLIKKAMSVKGI